MFLVGLTGGIATGKSTVANIFKENNIIVVDADVIARSIVKPGQKAWREIRAAFGDGVFNEDGELNRELLGKIIFADVNKRKLLNKITHPKIQRQMMWEVIKCFFEGHQFVVLDIPLLFETGTLLPFVYKIITVSCQEETQQKRLMDREQQYTEEDARQRIAAQMSLSDKCDKSHFVVDNSASRIETRQQVEKIIAALRLSRHHVTVRVYLAALLASVVFLLSLISYGFYLFATRRY